MADPWFLSISPWKNNQAILKVKGVNTTYKVNVVLFTLKPCPVLEMHFGLSGLGWEVVMEIVVENLDDI